MEPDLSTATDDASLLDAAAQEMGRVVLGMPDLLRGVLIGLVAGGHVLLEGPPGLGKTLLARALSNVVGGNFRRIQFTPDLMPSDVTGSNVYDPRSGQFQFRPGPVFAQILLADEINRAPAKTQAALLEAMAESRVTVDGETRDLPQPFFCLATQNPIESEGTYPLPEAQLDRFLVKLVVDHPPRAVELALLQASLDGFDAADLSNTHLRQVLDPAGVLRERAAARAVRVDAGLLGYVADIVGRTRQHPAVELGASPRASIALLRCAQVAARFEGRAYVVPDDVKSLAPLVLRHRLLLLPDALLEGARSDDVVAAILRDVPVPAHA